jgi:hypothetical protein
LWEQASTDLLQQEYQRGMIAILQRRAADAAALREEYDATPEARAGVSGRTSCLETTWPRA